MTDREAILKRRHRFIAMALAGGSAAALAGCATPVPCLRQDASPSDAPVDASAVPCLSIDAAMDAGSPEPDAGIPDDAGSLETDAGDPETDAGDAGSPEADAGDPDAGSPMPCLSVPAEKP